MDCNHIVNGRLGQYCPVLARLGAADIICPEDGIPCSSYELDRKEAHPTNFSKFEGATLQTIDCLVQNDRILCIEDNKVNQKFLKKSLSDLEDVVEIAQDGEEGWELLMKDPYKTALILLDLDMPKLNGFQFLERIQEGFPKNRNFAIVIVSSMEYAQIKKAMDLGADSYVNKPFDRKTLFKRTAQSLKLRR
jgi:CheY-like chemotaxis protein